MGKRKIEFTSSEKEFVTPLLLETKAACLANANPTFKKRAETIDELLAKFEKDGKGLYSEKQYLMISSCLNEHYPLNAPENAFASLTAIEFVEQSIHNIKQIEAIDFVVSMTRKLKKQKDGFTLEGVLGAIFKLKSAEQVCWSTNGKKINKLAFICKDEILVFPLGPHVKLSEIVWTKQSAPELELLSQSYLSCESLAEAKKQIAEQIIETNKKDIAFIHYVLGIEAAK